MKTHIHPMKIIFPLVLAVVIALAGELLLGGKSLLYPAVEKSAPAGELAEVPDPTEGRDRYQINADILIPVNGTVRQSYEDPAFLMLSMDNAYINHMVVGIDSAEDVPYTLLLRTYNIYGQEKYTEKDDVAAAMLRQGVTHCSDKVETLFLVLDSSNVEKLTEVRAFNRYEFSWQRFLLLLAVAISVCVLIFFKDLLLKRLEFVTLIILLSFGTALTFSHGFMPNSWDEQVHFSCTYQMSAFGQVPDSASYEDYYQLRYPSADTEEEQAMLAAYADGNAAETARMTPDYPYTTMFGRVGYIFQALGMALARLFGLSFTGQIYAANLFNLLCYALVSALAVKWCRIGKYALFFVALLPVQLVLATSFSYDAFVNAFLMLGYALFTQEYFAEGTLNLKRAAAGIVIMCIGILPKAVYFPILFLWCLLPKEKFSDQKKRVVFWGCVTLAALALAATFVLPTVLSGSGGTDLYSDPRRPAANTGAQLSMILHHPLKYAKLLLSNILSWQLPYYFGDLVWTNYVYPGRYVGTGRYLVPILFTFIAATQGSRGEVETGSLKKLKLGSLIVMFLSECLVWTALYLAFNPVGAERIKGVQGRYLIPVTFLMFLLFYNRKVRCDLKEETYRRILAGSAVYILFISMWVVYFGNAWWNVI